MALFEYHCAACGHDFSTMMTLSQRERAKVTCPKCQSSKVERVFTPFYAKTIRKS